MNTPKFKPRTLTATLELLCHAKGGKLLRAGKVNQSEIGRIAGTSQGNVSRWFAGEHHPSDENIKRLAKALKVSPAQMRGELPVNAIDGFSAASPEDEELYNELINLPEELKNMIREQVRLYKKLNNQT
jgi:transcriptional regulator with XRE-family HTH domain